MFVNSKVSSERERDSDSQLGHKKSMSSKSETSRTLTDDDIYHIPNIVEVGNIATFDFFLHVL